MRQDLIQPQYLDRNDTAQAVLCVKLSAHTFMRTIIHALRWKANCRERVCFACDNQVTKGSLSQEECRGRLDGVPRIRLCGTPGMTHQNCANRNNHVGLPGRMLRFPENESTMNFDTTLS
ncbi:hypothetical protein WOLCODRAFT_25016 [Wolfiporia cocos MD-104 SS10]|uniref:Uncharacterized protein n=1 Tax=Wolfiporia cocos (strain MD-104) TaxID=742152 RepID=A0A2H3K0C4_WOLCO|nr:hypothetical protein WOLCODRAFT_25016 [Wolfiporia cocos MD-104 SS10]